MKNTKNANDSTQIKGLFYKITKKLEIFAFCVITFQNERFCKRYLCSWQKKWPEVVLKRPFINRKFWETPSR